MLNDFLTYIAKKSTAKLPWDVKPYLVKEVQVTKCKMIMKPKTNDGLTGNDKPKVSGKQMSINWGKESLRKSRAGSPTNDLTSNADFEDDINIRSILNRIEGNISNPW